jgi:dihydrofolate reductase
MRVALVAAAADNDVIGRNNELPWHLPEDLRRFKALTLGKPVIMGRLTFESIRRPLPRRTNFVVSGRQDFRPDGVEVVAELETAIDRAKQVAARDGVDEVMVLGGGQIYRAALDRADRVYLTRVHARPDGDAWFPRLDPAQWRLVASDEQPADDENPIACSYCIFDRINETVTAP